MPGAPNPPNPPNPLAQPMVFGLFSLFQRVKLGGLPVSITHFWMGCLDYVGFLKNVDNWIRIYPDYM